MSGGGPAAAGKWLVAWSSAAAQRVPRVPRACVGGMASWHGAWPPGWAGPGVGAGARGRPAVQNDAYLRYTRGSRAL